VHLFRVQTRSFREKSQLAYLFAIVTFFFRAMWFMTWRQRHVRYDLVHVNSVPDFLVFSTWLPKLRGAKVPRYPRSAPGIVYQQIREQAQEQFSGDYSAFLQQSNMRLSIRSLQLVNLERAHELTQRTNQMNFSGNRYTRERLRELMDDPETDCYVIDCEEQFGSYGTVGFYTVNRCGPRMTDLMFSWPGASQARRTRGSDVSASPLPQGRV
jgi:hypothetical protein